MPLTSPRFITIIGAALAVLAAPAAAQSTDPVAQRALLNQQQAEAAQAQLEANAASQQAHDEGVQKEKAYEEALAKWKADVAACQAAGTCAKQ